MHSFHIIISLVALLPFIAMGRSTPSFDKVTIDQYIKFIASSTTLQYGDSCSWDDEVARQDWFVEDDKLDTKDPLSAKLFDQFVKDSLAQKRSFCTARSKLLCDHVTETCFCGETFVQVALGDRYKSSAYVLEQDEDVQSVCRYARSSPCYAPALRKLSNGAIESGCATGLECLSVEAQTPCTNSSFTNHVLQLKLEGKTFEQYKNDLYSGKICACLDGSDRDDEESNTVYRGKTRSGKYPKYGSNDRIKRSLTNSNSYHEQALAAWVPVANM